MASPIASHVNSSSTSSSSDSSTGSADGRAWKSFSKKSAQVLGVCALVALSIVSIAALAIGVAALVNPVGLAVVGGTVGAFVTAGLAFAAENAMVVVIVGSVGVGLLSLAGLITLVAKGCGLDSESDSDSSDSCL